MSADRVQFLHYYWSRMTPNQKSMVMEAMKTQKSTTYRRLSNPDSMTLEESRAFLKCVHQWFGHRWPADAVTGYVNITNHPRKPIPVK